MPTADEYVTLDNGTFKRFGDCSREDQISMLRRVAATIDGFARDPGTTEFATDRWPSDIDFSTFAATRRASRSRRAHSR